MKECFDTPNSADDCATYLEKELAKIRANVNNQLAEPVTLDAVEANFTKELLLWGQEDVMEIIKARVPSNHLIKVKAGNDLHGIRHRNPLLPSCEPLIEAESTTGSTSAPPSGSQNILRPTTTRSLSQFNTIETRLSPSAAIGADADSNGMNGCVSLANSEESKPKRGSTQKSTQRSQPALNATAPKPSLNTIDETFAKPNSPPKSSQNRAAETIFLKGVPATPRKLPNMAAQNRFTASVPATPVK